jgi:hypothetical protein
VSEKHGLLQGFHLFGLIIVDVVISEHMQDTVHNEKRYLIVD